MKTIVERPIIKIKNSLEVLISRYELAEERISEDGYIKRGYPI